MPQTVNDRSIYSLSEVARSIQKTLEERYTGSFWIKAEMNRLNHYPQSGHCYPDLVEKTDGKVVAEMRSIIWKDDYQRINDNFMKVLHEPLKNGITVLFCAKISFSPVYGLSLRILDIDPSWSLGELEKEKQETIEKIRKEGIFNANKALLLPLLPQRIAVVSVQTSKGYADFCKIIDENTWGYSFFLMLFPALLQGDHAVASILEQLDRIRTVRHHFDAVAIIRGGGGDVGLSCYNAYDLAKAVALFPLPVITGIGHSTNETVTEMVAFRNAITPTELADFLVQKFHNFSVPLERASESVLGNVTRLVQKEKSMMLATVRYLRSVTLSKLQQGRTRMQHEAEALRQQSAYFVDRLRERHINQNLLLIQKGISQEIKSHNMVIGTAAANFSAGIMNFIQAHRKNLSGFQKSVELLDPVNVLNRGYSITLVNDKAVKTAEDVHEKSILKTILAAGQVISVVQSVKKSEQ